MKKHEGYYVHITDKDIQYHLDGLLKATNALEKEENKKSFRARCMVHDIENHQYHLNRLIELKVSFSKLVVTE